ncbi:hypothetical protein GCM10023170_058510 [Phytohabitans houttuyneae]|uniref:DUF3710 domain-containing protein n=2 Tax=Phytohabitans houttuyneae TaxID=1076126 RepID=A0A6V8KAH4_9ACTN|nr:hypothetical protein Phou_019250 [Phytohabitans houttuyneae]
MFSRRREGGRHARDNSQRRARAEQHNEPPAGDEPAVPSVGPFDVSEAPDGVQRLDLGSLKIPAIDGVEVRVQANPDGAVQQVVLVHGENALQLGVFAAPRSEGIWEEVRAEIRKSLFDDGVAAEEIDGEYGVELRARVRTPEGLTDLRFVGIDGPRWMVRGVYQGGAAVDPAGAGPLVECLHGLVVDRGQEAKPVREPLPLRLPKELAAQAQEGAAGAQEPVVEVDDAPPPVNGSGPSQPPRRKPSPRPRRT